MLSASRDVPALQDWVAACVVVSSHFALKISAWPTSQKMSAHPVRREIASDPRLVMSSALRSRIVAIAGTSGKLASILRPDEKPPTMQPDVGYFGSYSDTSSRDSAGWFDRMK
jgi:hypothetical protein